jgi:hypothetical protein
MQLERPLYWGFDGVDESDSPGTMVKLFFDLSAHALPIRLLFISRKTCEISSAVQRLAKFIHIDTIQLEGNPDDFRQFIELELEDVAGKASYTSYHLTHSRASLRQFFVDSSRSSKDQQMRQSEGGRGRDPAIAIMDGSTLQPHGLHDHRKS